jgi:two-component system response regulator MprA
VSKPVLVVDDDSAIREILELALADEGYDVDLAGDGVEAIDKVNNKQPQLILLDWMMPRMDGEAFADELGRRGLRPAIPILMLTAAGNPEQKAARIGAEGFLTKPFELPTLLDEVARLVPA